VYTDFREALEKQVIVPIGLLKQLLQNAARGFREICVNFSKAFCGGKIKL
jgi:hypothetical protein